MLTQTRNSVGGRRRRTESSGLAPHLQARLSIREDLIGPRAILAVVAGQQSKTDCRWVHPLAAQLGDEDQVSPTLRHLFAVETDHAGMHIVTRESAITRCRFGMCRRELVVREDQIAATALDVEAGADAVECNRRAFDVPAGAPRPEG